MKIVRYLLVIIFSIFFINNVEAENIRSIRMDVDITKDGTAHIQEIWEVFVANEDKLTEIYRPYTNYGDSEFKNFKVSLDDKEYTYVKNWDINKKFKDKKYKNGFHQNGKTMELCWGISKKGDINTYKISYDITNFVLGAKDSDIVYWNLIPSKISNPIEKVYVKIYSSDHVYKEDIKVKDYGRKKSTATVKDGYIEIKNKGSLEDTEYIKVLIKYPKGTFNIDDRTNKNFNHYLKIANQASEDTRFTEDIPLLIILLVIGVPLISIFVIKKYPEHIIKIKKYITKKFKK